ncbi:MAG: group I intron-associated PD-(D/E)XK endonuclease [Candidatus Sulfotelmatobacter sp.]|jgi:hypothetical protein
MEYGEKFANFKERGEWVELQFMAEAARRRFAVCRPWGDNRAYDVGIEHGSNFLRVQVKSASCRMGNGYWCGFAPHYNKKKDYSVKQLDLFAAYVIPVGVWYLIPAAEMLGDRRRKGTMLFPVVLPVRKNSFRYECYQEAWRMLTKTRRGLARYGR